MVHILTNETVQHLCSHDDIKREMLGMCFVTVRAIKSVHQWLGNVINICNKKMGTPFQRCMRVFDGAVADCQATLGPLFNGLCSVTYLVSKVCYVVKIFDYICLFLEFVNDSVVGVVEKSKYIDIL